VSTQLLVTDNSECYVHQSENEPIENEAIRYDLKYIGLDGNIAAL
jgi:succinyl-CoA synthetase beta subunit